MPNFIESPRFPDLISYGVSFGPEFVTGISTNDTGVEIRNKRRDYGICVGECAHAIKSKEDLSELIKFFRSVKGRWTGYRFKDFSDFEITQDESYFEFFDDSGKRLQLFKEYSIAVGFSEFRKIICPVTSTFKLYDSSVLVPSGAGVGQYSIDNDGVVEMIATQDRTIASHLCDVGHTFTLSTILSPNAVIGQRVGVESITGTAAATLNDKSFLVIAVSGSDITVDVDTSGMDAAGGILSLYRQIEDLTFETEFDVPCRFGTDRMSSNIDSYNSYTWGQIPIQEIRAK